VTIGWLSGKKKTIPIRYTYVTADLFWEFVFDVSSFRTNSEAKRSTEFEQIKFNNSKNSSNNDLHLEYDYDTYVSVYSKTVAGISIGCLTVALLYFRFASKISINLHDQMFRSLVRAPISFFDKNPSGRLVK